MEQNQQNISFNETITKKSPNQNKINLQSDIQTISLPIIKNDNKTNIYNSIPFQNNHHFNDTLSLNHEHNYDHDNSHLFCFFFNFFRYK